MWCEGTARRESGAIPGRLAAIPISSGDDSPGHCEHRGRGEPDLSLPSRLDRQFLREEEETKEGIIWCLVGRLPARPPTVPRADAASVVNPREIRKARRTDADDRSERASGCRYHIGRAAAIIE